MQEIRLWILDWFVRKPLFMQQLGISIGGSSLTDFVGVLSRLVAGYNVSVMGSHRKTRLTGLFG